MASDDWVLLVPEGLEVAVNQSPVVTRPVLLTAAQLIAIADTAADMRVNNLPVDMGALIMRTVDKPRVRLEEAKQAARVDEDGWKVVETPAQPASFGCYCGRMYGSREMLDRHRRSCEVGRIPEESRTDGTVVE